MALALWLYLEIAIVCSSLDTMLRFIMFSLTDKTTPYLQQQQKKTIIVSLLLRAAVSIACIWE